MQRLFVYGTLAPGRENFAVVESIEGQWEEASVKGNSCKPVEPARASLAADAVRSHSIAVSKICCAIER